MSRALSVLEEFVPPSSINRGALMLDEGTVFNQWWLEDENGGDGGNALTLGDYLQDQAGNPWQVVQIGSGGTRRFGLRSLSGIQSPTPGGDWSLHGVIQNVSRFFMTQTGRAIELNPDGTFRGLSQSETGNLFPSGGGGGGTGGGGGGGGYATPQWRPGERELEERGLDIQQQQVVQDRQNLLDQLQIQHDQALQLAGVQHQQALEILNRQLEHAGELQKAQIQAQIDLENLRHDNNIKELQIRLDAEQKNIIYSEYGATKRTLIEQKGAMERDILQLGPDPAAQAAGLHAQVTRGITPQTMAVGRAQAFIDQPIPQMTMDMPIPQMQGVLAGMGGTQPPMFAGPGMSAPIGMARGGVIEMEKGKDGKYSMEGGQEQTILVGDGAGIIPGVTEALTFGKGKLTVTPIVGMAQQGWGTHTGWTPPGTSTEKYPGLTSEQMGLGPKLPPGMGGGTYAYPPTAPKPWPTGVPRGLYGGPLPPKPLTPEEELEQLRQSLIQMAVPIYGGSAFSEVPVALRGPAGGMAFPGGSLMGRSPLEVAGMLGARPQLIRATAHGGEVGIDPSHPGLYGHTYFIDESGQRHFIPHGENPEVLMRLGFDPSQVVLVAPSDVAQFSPAPEGTPIPGAGAVTGPSPEFGAIGWPLIEPTSGAFLPAIHKIAGRWKDMSLAQQINAASLYKAAGRSPEVLQSILTAATPTGMGARRIGGIGMGY